MKTEITLNLKHFDLFKSYQEAGKDLRNLIREEQHLSYLNIPKENWVDREHAERMKNDLVLSIHFSKWFIENGYATEDLIILESLKDSLPSLGFKF